MLTGPGRRSALIDLGTNSVRLLIVEAGPDGLVSIVHQEKRPVRLGEGSFLDHQLTEEAMGRALTALGSFIKTARAFHVEGIKAVATSATRDADNRDYFVQKVYSETGIRLKVVSGLEEARLIYLGVSRNLNLGREPSLMVDIGGGSLELIIGDQNGPDLLDSLPLGAARLTALFDFNANDGLVEPNQYQKLVDYVTRHTQRFRQQAQSFTLKSAYGSSGTIGNLAVIHNRRESDSGDKSERMSSFLPAAALRGLGLWLGAMDTKSRRRVSGLDSQKVHIIVAGCAIVEALLASLNLKGLTAVEYGLKHGLLHEFAAEHLNDGQGLPGRENSVRNFARRCRYDEEHAENTAAWAKKIMAQFVAEGLLEYDERDAELVYLAALLHDVGKFLAYENHHIHSWYLIKNASLTGFDEDEIDLMAYLALNHKKKKKRDDWPYSTYLNHSRSEYLPKLGFVLRLAEVIDSSRQGVIADFKMKKFGSNVTCFLGTTSGDVSSQEIAAVNKLSKEFGYTFGLTLTVSVY